MSRKRCHVPAFVAASILLLAGCDAGQSTDETMTAPALPTAGAATTTSTPDAATPEEPQAFGPATLVAGEMACSLFSGPTTTNEIGTVEGREGRVECSYELNDPRVTGESTETWLSDRWEDDNGGTILVQWGTARLENADGAWEGSYTGAYNGETDTITYWYRGTGAYEGLTFHAWLTAGPRIGPRPTWLMEGIIYPGEPPELP